MGGGKEGGHARKPPLLCQRRKSSCDKAFKMQMFNIQSDHIAQYLKQSVVWPSTGCCGWEKFDTPPLNAMGGQKRLSSVRRKSCGFQCTQYNHTTQGWTQFETRLIHGQVPFRGQKLLQFTCCSFVKQASILSLGTSQFSLSSIVNAMQCQVL